VVALELIGTFRSVHRPGTYLPELGVDVILRPAKREHLEEGDDLVVAVVLTEVGRTVVADLDLDRVIARSTPHGDKSIEHAFDCLLEKTPLSATANLALFPFGALPTGVDTDFADS
jgi:hypothetical protein